MTISYKWLSDYLPVTIEPEKLSRILTSIGLEVERMEKYEEVKGGLEGLVVGEVIQTEKHPNADKLTLTKVNTGNGEPLQIVCGAPNVAAGQKVVVATVGTTIYPIEGEPITMKVAKIRGSESYGMICAEDEIGLGESHAGILVLPGETVVGTMAKDHFNVYSDYQYEIGLTPNRMDAMSHWGVARDICAYLSHHERKDIKPVSPNGKQNGNGLKPGITLLPIKVVVENTNACPRYSGVSISNVSIKESPLWLQQKLKSIGVRPINNMVDITNFVQHETGQPLHAFDADTIKGKKIVVKNLSAGTKFTTLDDKERNLNEEDLMICDAEKGICIAGVFGGLYSGVTGTTKNIFLESACFDPVSVRKTSFAHNLRTDAASRFEKGVDISATVNVLKRAIELIKEICGGEMASEIVDIYPNPKPKTEVAIKWHFIKKLSGKNYHPDAIMKILTSLGFEIVKEGIDELRVSVPYHKPDISLAADLVEEILRIDGLDNVEIPEKITITPAVEEKAKKYALKEKVSDYLVGLGFHEIMTNSITDISYFSPDEQGSMVKMINSLSAELNILRNSLFETALEVVAHNLNHKNNSLHLFEFGNVYQSTGPGQYQEYEKLSLVLCGKTGADDWGHKYPDANLFYLKGIVDTLFTSLGIIPDSTGKLHESKLQDHIIYKLNGKIIAGAGEVKKINLAKFGIKQAVYFAELNWTFLAELTTKNKVQITELPRFPAMQRDLAVIVPKNLTWEKVNETVQKIKLNKLQGIKLFDIFESEKLGKERKSIAINFTFQDDEKTLTDKEVDEWMKNIIKTFETDLSAEIRK